LVAVVVGRPDQRAGRRQALAHGGELVERGDLPGQVVQADGALPGIGGRGPVTEREERDVVMVGAGRGPHEDVGAGTVDDGREAEHVRVEAAVRLRVTDVQDRVVHAPDHETTSTGVSASPRRKAPSWRRHSTDALSDWTLTMSV